MNDIIPRKEDYNQVCVWPATIVGAENAKDFEAQMLAKMGVRVQYLEEVVTKPDYDNTFDMNVVPGTGGRNDLIFAIHVEDIIKFAVPRFGVGIRWIEDVLDPINHNRHMYDCGRLDKYRNW